MGGRKDHTYMRYEFEVLGRSPEQIAKEHGLALSTLERRIKRESWGSGSSEKCMERLIRISDKLECSIENTLSEPLDIKSCKELTAAIKDAVAIRRNLFRLPTQAEEFAQKISAQKLEKQQGEEEDAVVSVEFQNPDYSD